MRCQFVYDGFRPAVDDVNADVGIEEVFHASGSKFWTGLQARLIAFEFDVLGKRRQTL